MWWMKVTKLVLRVALSIVIASLTALELIHLLR